MNNLVEDLDDSSLFCKSLIKKHKNINSQHPKQLKLTFYQSSKKTNQSDDYKQVEYLSRSKAKSTKSNNDWNLNESKSSYFNAKVSYNSCPVCLKSFNSDSAYCAHMKQCAKMHQMTTQQLLQALELQKKQMQERRDMGLCSQSASLLKNNATKKSIKKDKESYDLALGLALSKSLTTCEKKGVSSQEVPKVTLEEFGFKSNTATTSRKRYDNKKFVLKDRTMEERQKIIVEKVAVILLDEDVEEKDLKKEKLNQKSSHQSHEVHQLWNLGQNDEKCEWYVSKIKPLILLKEESTGMSPKSILSDNIKSEISRLSLPRKEIFNDWQKLINSDYKSDWVGKTKDGQNINLHSLVLCVRCPEIFEKDCESVFQKFNLSTIIVLLEYLYCGTLNGLIRSEINNLYDLVVELNFNELIDVLNDLKGILLEDRNDILNEPLEPLNNRNSDVIHEVIVTENKKCETVEEKDLFMEDVVDLTQSSPNQVLAVSENSSEDESNDEKSYWSFIQHQKEKESTLIRGQNEEAKTDENQRKERLLISNENDGEEKNLINVIKSNKVTELSKKSPNDLETPDLVDEFQSRDEKMNSNDCIIISSGSESISEEKIFKSQADRLNTPSPDGTEYEIPHFDFYSDFHCFSEEQFSPVSLKSQSLLVGDISTESLKLSNPAETDVRQSGHFFQEELKETVGFCSTPVSVRRVSKLKSSNKNSTVRSSKRKRSDLSANRILRKSLNLQHKVRNSKLSSFKKSSVEKRRSCSSTKRFAEALTNSILNELSRSSVFNSSPLRAKKYMEITPINKGEEFGESVTPSPNYSNMGGSMLKEQLKKYGLKKNLAKSKAKKILKYIYEELHPFYNKETKKIVKMIHTSPKTEKKSKSKASRDKNNKISRKKNDILKEKSESSEKTKDLLNFSQESEVLTDTTLLSLNRSLNRDSDESEFDELSETLTQSVPNSSVDLPSVFDAFIRNNPEYHQKILLYEPIWLEELQKKLKEAFKKHFKLSDLMDFLDRKCVTFRSAAQTKRLQRRNEKKENSKKKKRPLK